MKLSEILSKPFKVKGGGIVNLKGLSKHIIDKEVGGNSDTSSMFDKIFDKILDMTPHSTKVVHDNTVVDLPDTPDNEIYYFLYKKSDFSTGRAIIRFVYNNSPQLNTTTNYEMDTTYNIDGEEYVTLTDGMA